MKRITVLLASMLLAATIPFAAAAAPPKDAVTGSFTIATISGAVAHANVTARSAPDGSNATGNVMYLDPEWYVASGWNTKMAVECLTVIGNRAVIGGPFVGDPADFPFGPVFTHGSVVVEDNGPASAEPRDRGLAQGMTFTDCDPLLLDYLDYFTTTLIAGNVRVYDAP